MNVYKVGYGIAVSGTKYDANIGSYYVMAATAKEAIEKAEGKLESGKETDGETWTEIFESVGFILTIDIE